MIRALFFFFTLFLPLYSEATIKVGVGKSDITPPIGTPSAGYFERKGEGMTGVHDPLLAIALYIDNGEKEIVLCSVDHLGFTYEMAQVVIQRVKSHPKLFNAEIYISSSHTHSGSGAFVKYPELELLAGAYNPEIVEMTIDKTADAIIQATQNLITAKIGIGYGDADRISRYRASFPKDVEPLSQVSVIKVIGLDDLPIAVVFNFPVHPTVLNCHNRLFSSDFVGYARDHLQEHLGKECQPIYLNGAQGDINPLIFNKDNRFHSCKKLGTSLAHTVQHIWDKTAVSENLNIETKKLEYTFAPQATTSEIKLPIESYETEINLILLNHSEAFVTVPGELSCIYDKMLKEFSLSIGYKHLSIFGLTNDAHGYIILPDAWRAKTNESKLSFGGENYGEFVKEKIETLLKQSANPF